MSDTDEPGRNGAEDSAETRGRIKEVASTEPKLAEKRGRLRHLTHGAQSGVRSSRWWKTLTRSG